MEKDKTLSLKSSAAPHKWSKKNHQPNYYVFAKQKKEKKSWVTYLALSIFSINETNEQMGLGTIGMFEISLLNQNIMYVLRVQKWLNQWRKSLSFFWYFYKMFD